MVFCIFPENLNDLENIVVSLFKNVEYKNVRELSFNKYPPLGEKELKHKIYIIPLENIQMLHLSFPVPYTPERYKTAVSFSTCIFF